MISFGIVNEGASFVNEELHTVDRPHAAAGDRKEGVRRCDQRREGRSTRRRKGVMFSLVKHVAEDGLRQWVHQVPHPHWKQLPVKHTYNTLY